MENKKDIIVFDLDGTLSLVGERVKYLEQTPKDWDSYFSACDQDEVNFPIAETYIHMAFNYRCIIVTGRRESEKYKTLKWLEKNNMCTLERNLLMRKTGDKRHDVIIKPEMVEKFKDRILMIYEDRTCMVEKWRELGHTCVQVAPGDF